MTVHILCRSPYEGPAGKHLVQFKDKTILAWFQNHREYLAHEDANDRLKHLLGHHSEGFGPLFSRAAEAECGPPNPKRKSGSFWRTISSETTAN